MAALAICVGAAEFASLAYETVFLVIPRPLPTDPVRTAINIFRWAGNVVFVLVGTVMVARAPNWLYVFVNGIVVAVITIVDVVGRAGGLFEQTVVEFVAGFIVLNLYLLMMAYLHWPINREKARRYEGGMGAPAGDCSRHRIYRMS
jgi:uncharacterized membrane protein